MSRFIEKVPAGGDLSQIVQIDVPDVDEDAGDGRFVGDMSDIEFVDDESEGDPIEEADAAPSDPRLQAALQVLLSADSEEDLAEAQEIARRIMGMDDAAITEAMGAVSSDDIRIPGMEQAPTRRQTVDVSESIDPEALEAAHSLAVIYAGAFNTLEIAGEDVEDLAQDADEELDGSGWNLARSRSTGRWVAVRDAAEDDEIDAVPIDEAGGERAPKGGIELEGRHYRGGQFIPAKVVASLPPEEREKLEQAKANAAQASQAKADARKARGSVDTGKLQGRLAQHADRHGLTDFDRRRAGAAARLLHRHHGELALHRVEELADRLEAALARVGDDEWNAEGLRANLGQQLARLHAVREGLQSAGVTGEVKKTVAEPAKAKEPWEMTRGEHEKANKFPQAIWDQVRSRAQHITKDGRGYVVEMPVPGKPGFVRMATWDNRGPAGHEDVPEDEKDDWLKKNAYRRGDKLVRVVGGIGGSFPSASYAGMGFAPSASGIKGVRSFVGPADHIDWMTSRLASGGYKTEIEDIEEPPAESGQKMLDGEKRIPDHRTAIESALASGKPVPPEVLADYPDLAEKYAAKPSTRPEDEPGFTGTDSLGREWQDGKLVAKQEDAAPATAGGETATTAANAGVDSGTNSLDSGSGSGNNPPSGPSGPSGGERPMEPIKTKTGTGVEVTLTPSQTSGGATIRAELNHPTLGPITLSDVSWVKTPTGQYVAAGIHGKNRVLLSIPKADYDRAAAAIRQSRTNNAAAYKSGTTPIRLTYQQGSPLSGHTASESQAGELLKELGLARDVSGWGTYVRPEVQKELGDSFTYQQAKELSDRLHAPAREAEAKNQSARQERVSAAQAEARRTGRKVLIGSTLAGETEQGHVMRQEWVDQDGKISTTYFRE